MNLKRVGITFASTMLFATITSGLLLSSSSTHATDDSAVTVTEITVPSSCSMTANVSTPHVADIVNGNRAINIGKTTLSTFCNDPGGFAIYAIGYTNNELGSTNVIASNNTDTIATGNTAPSNNSSWGMKVVNNSTSSYPATITPYFNVATNDGYVAVPSTFTLMASRNSGTAMDSATLLDTTYGAYISTTQPVGEYNGQVLYTMVHPSSAAGPNAGTMFEAAFLMQPTPPTKKTVGSNSYYKMQDMTPDICTVMSIGAEGQMVDDRDDKIYWVLKARDGKCWMTQNLDHDIVTTANFYTPANTNVTSNWTAPSATIPSTSISSGGAFSGWSAIYNPRSVDPGDWYFTDTFFNDACLGSAGCNYIRPGTSFSQFSQTPYPANGMHGHVGNYYNWAAAVASDDGSAYATPSMSDLSAAPQSSICPAGWRLPFSSNNDDSDDFVTLLNVYDAYITEGDERDKNMLSAPLYFIRGGAVVQDGSIGYAGYSGNNWTGTVYSSSSTTYLGFRFDIVLPNDSLPKYYGAPVRCLVDPRSIADITYMQDITPAITKNTAVGTTVTLKDKRDNKSYTVSKMADGRVWMLDNLALDITNSSILSGLNLSNTNASNETLGYLKGTTSRNPSTDPNGKYAIAGVTKWTSGFNYGAPLANLDQQDVAYGGSDPMASEVTAGGWKIGGFYNYCAASAGSYCFGNGDSNPGTPTGSASEDICPFGWRMPTGGSGGELLALTTAVTGQSGDLSGEYYTAFRRVMHLPLSGFFDAEPKGQGEGGFIETSTLYSNKNMHTLTTSTAVVRPTLNQHRLSGFSVRCVAK